MLKQLRTFASAHRGMAAVEFALIAPVMIAMFYGAVELSSAVDCNSRVQRVAAATSDLVAQSTKVSSTDLNNIFAAGNAILYPYPTGSAQVVISSLVDKGNGVVQVAWSYATANATARTAGSTVTVPTGLIVSGSGGSVILSEVTYTYASPVTHFLTPSFTMTQQFYSRPRRSITVAKT